MSDEPQEIETAEEDDPEVEGHATNLNSSKSNVARTGPGLGLGPSDFAAPKPPDYGDTPR